MCSGGAIRVLRTLTPNHRAMFRILMDMYFEQLRNNTAADASSSNDQSSSGKAVRYNDFFEQCRSQFCVNNVRDLDLKLREFLDHRMVQRRTGKDGQVVLCLMMSPIELEELSTALDEMIASK